MSIYKKLLKSDVASVPFNANKKYSFTSASAASNNIQLISTEYNSASLHVYSSGSQDIHNTLKYHQLDHLFYKNYKIDVNNKLGDIHYLLQKRELYKKANIISIPSLLYGLEIKPGSFYLSGSSKKIIDDEKGNLIISGTDLNNHSINELERVFALRNMGGFKHYDLNSHFYRKLKSPNDPPQYYNRENEIDSSYYLNNLTYKNISFSEVTPEILEPNIIQVGFNITSSLGYQFTPEEKNTLFEGGHHYWGIYGVNITGDYLTASFSSNNSHMANFGVGTYVNSNTAESTTTNYHGDNSNVDGELRYYRKDKNNNLIFLEKDAKYKTTVKIQSKQEDAPLNEYFYTEIGGGIQQYSFNTRLGGKAGNIYSTLDGTNPLGVFSNVSTTNWRAQVNSLFPTGEVKYPHFTDPSFNASIAMGNGVSMWPSSSFANANFRHLMITLKKSINTHSGSISDISVKKIREVGDTQISMLDFNDIITKPKELIQNHNFETKAPDNTSVKVYDTEVKWYNTGSSWTVSNSTPIVNNTPPILSLLPSYVMFVSSSFGADGIGGTTQTPTSTVQPYPSQEGDFGGSRNRSKITFVAPLSASNITLTPNNVTLEEGKSYKLKVVVNQVGSSSALLTYGPQGGIKLDENGILEDFTTFGTHTRIITPTSNTSLNFKASSDHTFIEIDEISVKEIVKGAHSSIVSPNDNKYNFNPGDNFTIAMFVNPKKINGHILSKTTSKTVIPTPLNSRYGIVSLKRSGSSQPREVTAEPQYPFEIYIDSGSRIVFERSDGERTTKIHTHINIHNKVMTLSHAPKRVEAGNVEGTWNNTTPQSLDMTPIDVIVSNNPPSHIVCMCSASEMSIWVNGDKMVSGSDLTVKQTQNKANLYIGSKGERSSFYSGSIGNLVIFNQSKTTEQIRNLYYNLNGYPYVGNIFYSNGLATITNPQYNVIAKPKTHQHTRYYPLDDVHTSSLDNKGSGSFLDLGPYKYNSSGWWNVNHGPQPISQSTYSTLPYTTTHITMSSKVVSQLNSSNFETVTHNNFTGKMLLFSSSTATTHSDGTTGYPGGGTGGIHYHTGGEFISLGADGDSVDLASKQFNYITGSNFANQQFIEGPNKNPPQPRRGKWSLSFLAKEAKGFHNTASVLFSSDKDLYETTPFDNPSQNSSTFRGNFLWKNQFEQLEIYDRAGQAWSSDYSSSSTGTPHNNTNPTWNSGAGITPHFLQPHYFTTWSESNHIVLCWDGTDEHNSTMTFYRNGIYGGIQKRRISQNKYSGSFALDAIGSSQQCGFSGSIGQVRWFDYCLTHDQVKKLNQDPSGDVEGDTINKLEFKGSHYIYENEYKCTVESHEYNYTHNITSRKIQSDQQSELADFATGSLWNPYVTTIGLYDENNELLVIGKLGQPIRMSDETDTTFIVRWDT